MIDGVQYTAYPSNHWDAYCDIDNFIRRTKITLNSTQRKNDTVMSQVGLIRMSYPVVPLYIISYIREFYKMENSQSRIPTISFILKKISDDKALTLFNSIASADGDKFIPLKEMNLTTKQYYSRISGLLAAGLIKRQKGKYSLTMLGKVVYQSQMLIGKTLTYHWKLKAIESIQMSASAISGLPEGHLAQLINALMTITRSKTLLCRPFPFPLLKIAQRFQQV